MSSCNSVATHISISARISARTPLEFATTGIDDTTFKSTFTVPTAPSSMGTIVTIINILINNNIGRNVDFEARCYNFPIDFN